MIHRQIIKSAKETIFPSGEIIFYGEVKTQSGNVIVLKSSFGICDFKFTSNLCGEIPEFIKTARSKAELVPNLSMAKEITESVLCGKLVNLDLHLIGTEFQHKVWDILMQIPKGYVITYKNIAEKIKNPSAVRAVGQAVGKNPLHYIIPCHRVINSSGEIGGYAGGTFIKKRLLEAEGVY